MTTLAHDRVGGDRARSHGYDVVPALITLGIFLVLLSGRTETPGWEDVGVRFVIAFPLLLLFLVWRAAVAKAGSLGPLGNVPKLVILLFSLHLLSSLWHRTGANVVEGVANGLLLLLLIHMTATMARHDPEGMRRRLVILMIGAGVVFMLGSALTGATSGIGRAVAFGGGPNVFVRIMVWAAIAVVVIANTRGRRRWLILLPALLLFAALSGSRGGITAAAITAAVMALVLISKLRGRHVAATVVLAPAVIWFIWTNDQVQYLLTRRFTWSGIVDSGYGHRETLWLAGWQIFQESPVAGQGMDAFNALAGVSSGFPYPHNVIIEFADDMGIIGISVLTALFMVFVRLVVAHNGKLSASQYGLIAAVVFTLVASLFSGDIYDSRFLWIFMVAVFPLAERPAKLSSKSQVSPKHNIARK